MAIEKFESLIIKCGEHLTDAECFVHNNAVFICSHDRIKNDFLIEISAEEWEEVKSFIDGKIKK